jgi:hypothetical protein
MTQTQFVENEVKAYIKFLFPKVTDKQLEERLQESDYRFNEEMDKITVDIRIDNKYQSITLGWSDDKGIYDLHDEDEEDDYE